MGNGSRYLSVDNWEAYIGVGFGWDVGFSTCTCYTSFTMSTIDIVVNANNSITPAQYN